PASSNDDSAHEFARSVGAVVADRNNESGYRLSPSSLQKLPPNIRLVIPSPKGSQLSLFTGATPAISRGLRKLRAVAETGLGKGEKHSGHSRRRTMERRYAASVPRRPDRRGCHHPTPRRNSGSGSSCRVGGFRGSQRNDLRNLERLRLGKRKSREGR